MVACFDVWLHHATKFVVPHPLDKLHGYRCHYCTIYSLQVVNLWAVQRFHCCGDQWSHPPGVPVYKVQPVDHFDHFYTEFNQVSFNSGCKPCQCTSCSLLCYGLWLSTQNLIKSSLIGSRMLKHPSQYWSHAANGDQLQGTGRGPEGAACPINMHKGRC